MMLAIVGLLVAVLVIWLVRFSPVLAVRKVDVEGNKSLSVAQVLQAAQVPKDQPLVQVDEKAIAARVSSLVQVSGASVHTRLPDTVVIELTERTVVYQRHSGQQYQSVDAKGVIFAVGTSATRGVVTATTGSVDNHLLAAVATVVASLPSAVRKRVQTVDAPTADTITLKLTQGQSVLWGGSEASEDKARVLQVLLTQKGTVFDVSSPGSPAVR